MKIFLGLALAWAISGSAGSTPLQVVSEGPAVQIGATQMVIHSERVGRDFLIKVSSPMAPVPAWARRPVIYALDGGYEVAGPIAWVLGGAGAMEAAYVISVGYEPSDYHWRDDDLAHEPYRDEHGRMVGGKAAAFEAFLIDELKPFIESRYPVEPGRSILFGHSEGGLFAANILSSRPQAFWGYLIASPCVWCDPDVLPRLSGAVREAGEHPVFLAVGETEPSKMLKGEADLAAALRSGGSKLKVESVVFGGGSHISYYPALITQAFTWFLPPKP